jgi:Septum formation initiator
MDKKNDLPNSAQDVSCTGDKSSLEKCVNMMKCYNVISHFQLDSMKLEMEKNTLKDQVAELQNRWEKWDHDLSVLSVKNGALQDKNKSLTDSVMALSKKIQVYEESNPDITDLQKQNQKLKQDSISKENQINTLQQQLDKYNEIREWLGQPFVWCPLCAILMALIISVTLIALRKGFTFTKGNTTVSVGRTKTKKKTEG